MKPKNTKQPGRAWKRAALAMSAVCLLSYAGLMPAILANTRPDSYWANVRDYWLFNPQALADSDADGLPDQLEGQAGTAPTQADSDGDGLSDYDEVRKYCSSPLNPDSDGDGISDADWAERREFTYTLQAIVDLRPPFDLADMNDFYQDARLLEVAAANTKRFEVILYPLAKELLNPAPYRIVDNANTAPTLLKDWTPAMRAELSAASAGYSDLALARRILARYSGYQYLLIDRDLGYSTDYPLGFDIWRDADGRVHKDYTGLPLGASMEEIEQKTLYASGMFRNGSHYSCGSESTLRGAMFRAAGLEERTIFTIPLFYTLAGDATVIKMGRAFPRQDLDQPQDNFTVADHFFNEVKIGGRWIRVDQAIDAGLNNFKLKLIACHDQTDLRFPYMRSESWVAERPYRYLSISDQEAIHPEPR